MKSCPQMDLSDQCKISAAKQGETDCSSRYMHEDDRSFCDPAGESNWRSGGREISKAAIFLSGARAPNCSYPTSQNRELRCQKSRLHQTARQNDVACIVYRMRDNNSLRPHLKMHSGEKSTSVIDPTSVRRPTCSRLLDKTV